MLFVFVTKIDPPGLQSLVRAALDNLTVDHKHLVGMADGGEAMRNDFSRRPDPPYFQNSLNGIPLLRGLSLKKN